LIGKNLAPPRPQNAVIRQSAWLVREFEIPPMPEVPPKPTSTVADRCMWCLIAIVVVGAVLAGADLPAFLLISPFVVAVLAVATWLQARSERVSAWKVFRRSIRSMWK